MIEHPVPTAQKPAVSAPIEWLRQLDLLLRGEATKLSALQRGRIELPENGISLVVLALGLFYGACMGTFAIFNKGELVGALLQMCATMAKVPALFFSTLLVTFPSLYVFNALVGSRLTLASVWRLMIAMLAVMMAILASLGPIVAFFSISTTNYPFMLILNVVVFGLAGFLGLKFLLHTLHRLSIVLEDAKVEVQPVVEPENVPASTCSAPEIDVEQITPAQNLKQLLPTIDSVPKLKARKDGALDRVDDRMLGSDVKTVFYLWIVVFGLVGAQMSWLLRPFISAPDKPFILFSARESNFYAAVWDALQNVMGIS